MKNKYFHYHVTHDFCISDIEYCGEGRTVDMTVLELYENKEILNKMGFPSENIESYDAFLVFLSKVHGRREDDFVEKLTKLVDNPTLRILDNSKTQKILKKQIRRKKLLKLEKNI